MSVDPVLRQGYRDLIVQVSQADLQPVDVEGFRSPERQDALFEQGGVTNARGGQSFHNWMPAMIPIEDVAAAERWLFDEEWPLDVLGAHANDDLEGWWVTDKA